MIRTKWESAEVTVRLGTGDSVQGVMEEYGRLGWEPWWLGWEPWWIDKSGIPGLNYTTIYFKREYSPPVALEPNIDF